MPFVLGAGLLAWVLLSVDRGAVLSAMRHAPKLPLFALAFVFVLAILSADSWATAQVYSRTVCPVRYRELWVIRGASYLPSIVNHHVGQGWLTYFLAKVYDARLWRVAGATLIVYITTFACLVGIGLVALPFNSGRLTWMGPLLGGCVVAGLAFLGVLHAKPRWLAERQLFAPLFELGVAGHLRLLLSRLSHVSVLFFGTWLPFQLFGVDIPLSDALALVPPMMFVAALPLTPQGVGTRDALATYLFSTYAAPGVDGAAVVVATTLSWVTALTLVQLVISPPLMRRAYRLLRDAAGRAPAPGTEPGADTEAGGNV
jgi:hypothetical protein